MAADLGGPPANPSSVHSFGREARTRLSEARRAVSSFFEAKPDEIVFTSGGTEAINLLLRGLGAHGHIVTTAIEHSAVYKTIQSLQAQGLQASFVPVGLWGAPLPEEIERAVRPETRALVLSLCNGETGVKIDLDAIGAIAEKRNIPLLLDGVAFIGKDRLSLPKSAAAVALSGHKIHGPKGIGALFLRSSLKLSPLLTGGGQEFQKRAGTENLPGILGLAEAIRIFQEDQEGIIQTLRDLRNHLENGILRTIPDIAINGQGPRVSNVSNLAILGVDGETLLMHLDMAGIAVSHGSACASGSLEPSRVLTEMGIDKKTARSSIRFSISRMNTREEIEAAVEKLGRIVSKIRKISS